MRLPSKPGGGPSHQRVGQPRDPYSMMGSRRKKTPYDSSSQYLGRLLAGTGLAALSLGFAFFAQAETRSVSAMKPGASSEFFNETMQNEGGRDGSFRFLTDVSVAIGVASVRGGDYAGEITREFQSDILSVRKWFAHFGVRERSLFDPSPAQFDHELEYLGIGYEMEHGRIRLFWDHTCYNPSRKLPEEKRNGIHWNELGLGYESTGIRLGNKNDRIRFDPGSEWLNKFNWKASLSKIWMRTENRYEWIFKLDIRDDVVRMGNHVFFIQIGGDAIYDERGMNQNVSLEIGDRIRLNDVTYLIAFASYDHFHDWYRLDDGEDFFSAGISLEMGLGREGSKRFSNRQKPKIAWAPRFRVNGGYAKFVDDEEYGYSSDVGIDLEFLRIGHNKTLSLNTYAGMLTLPHDLNPYFVMYRAGPSLGFALDNLDLSTFHSYSGLYGLEGEGVIRDYHFLGLDLEKDDAGYWDWHFRTGVYPSTKNFDFWGDLEGSLGYEAYAARLTPYIRGSGHYLLGNRSVFGRAVEAGIKIPGKVGSLCLYFRHQDDFDAFRFGRGTRTLVGFRRQV